ncbi:MAG: hypothetical protein VB078_11750 [Clostridiaceae bacterium]|nr:hypothetical protein [Clostridiaceae bacterium]
MKMSGGTILIAVLLIVLMGAALFNKNNRVIAPITDEKDIVSNVAIEENKEDDLSIQKGDVITVSDVSFTYEGFYQAKNELIPMEHFLAQNTGEKNISVILEIVGVKKDGTYDFLGTGVFGGVDQALYDKELKENGWAVEKYTNKVDAGSSLNAYANILDIGDQYSMDVDSDGYYDVMFSIITLNEKGGFTITGEEPVSEIFKLKVQ